uniref:RNA helicase n=1 Tax=Bartheletia paradoxa TaxID=669517 RepID=A0A2D0XHW3_9BASI|nr:hypothetical protein SPAR04460 [Bartheletia paradoxa]
MSETVSFSSFSNILDARLLRALATMGFANATLVQAKAIPLALEGKDILARARTGSGKTASYCLPVVQKILSAKQSLELSDPTRQTTRALMLVPTRELAEQVAATLRSILEYCEKEVIVANIAGNQSLQLQKLLLADNPDILIATPSRVLSHLQAKTLSLAALESLVIDEADLILSYGHDEDVKLIFSGGFMPKVFQSFLMSATMTKDVEILKGLVMRNPAILRLEEDEDEAAFLTQYSVHCSEEEKFLLTYVILKLRLVKGKCILFVNDIERCYRLKLFLEQFSIKSCVLNSELPLNSRFHIVQEFNKGVYDYIIATDEAGASAEKDSDDEKEDDEEEEEEEKEKISKAPQFLSTQPAAPGVDDEEFTGMDAGPSTSSASLKRKRNSSSKSKKKRRDKEYGVSRGVDFVDVSCVINFDFPSSSRSYTHRVGRTARAGRTGMSLSFVVPIDQVGKSKTVSLDSARADESVFERVEKDQGGRGSKIKEYKFDMQQVDAFRYRMEDALRSVTRNAIKEARLKELKTEIINSDKLKAHFEDNPLDLAYLRHDKPLHPTRVQSHMKHVPSYLMPRIAPVVPGGEGLASSSAAGTGTKGETKDPKIGFVGFTKQRGRGGARGGRGGRGGTSSGRGGSVNMRGGQGKKKGDPLRNF